MQSKIPHQLSLNASHSCDHWRSFLNRCLTWGTLVVQGVTNHPEGNYCPASTFADRSTSGPKAVCNKPVPNLLNVRINEFLQGNFHTRTFLILVPKIAFTFIICDKSFIHVTSKVFSRHSQVFIEGILWFHLLGFH